MTKIRYATEECSRCGGTGAYSWNALTGSTCFKCNGGRRQFTAQGAKARKAVQALLDELTLTPAALVGSGDRVDAGKTMNRKGFALVEKVELAKPGTVTSNGVDVPMVYFTFHQGRFSYGMPVAEKIRVKPTDEQWQQVLDLASTLTGVELVEVETAQA